MKLPIPVISVIGLLTIASASITVGTSANAATLTGTFDCNTHPGTTISADAGDTINFTSLTNCGNIEVLTSLFTAASASNGAPVTPYTPPAPFTYWQAGGITSFTLTIAGGVSGTFSISGSANAGTAPTTVVTVSINSGGGGSSTSTVSEPASIEFIFEPTSGTVCSTTSETSTAGSWLSLPTANECTPPATTPDARLLGWATTPDFPVAIAQRQVDNGWGAYEIFNDEGQITAVFIPAGGATQVSSAATLYPIWKS